MISVLLLALASAQDPARAPRLQLGDVYREARAASPRIQAARALALASRARVAAAGLLPDPQFQFGFMNYELPRLAPMDQIGMVQIQVMQMIPTAGKRGLSGRIAGARADAVSERASEVDWDVRANVAMAFYDLHATDRGLDVARQTLRLLENILRTAESMYRVGEGRQADVLRAQVEVGRMVEDTIRMTAMRTGTAGRLNAILDRPAGASVLSPQLPAFPDSLPSVDALVALAIVGRPMVKAGERDLAAAHSEAKLARQEIWPDLAIGVQYGRRGAVGGAGGADHMGSLMLGASIPVFAGRRQLRMRQETAAMSQMAEADLATMRADTRAAVVEAHANLVRARHLAVLYRTTIIPQAEATVASALAAYRVGSVDFMTLLDDGMTANRFRLELFALEANEGQAWSELEMLVGRELWNPNAVSTRSSPRPEREE
jgi:outer membrane protein TolC